jgi:hypothetical protein
MACCSWWEGNREQAISFRVVAMWHISPHSCFPRDTVCLHALGQQRHLGRILQRYCMFACRNALQRMHVCTSRWRCVAQSHMVS